MEQVEGTEEDYLRRRSGASKATTTGQGAHGVLRVHATLTYRTMHPLLVKPLPLLHDQLSRGAESHLLRCNVIDAEKAVFVTARVGE